MRSLVTPARIITLGLGVGLAAFLIVEAGAFNGIGGDWRDQYSTACQALQEATMMSNDCNLCHIPGGFSRNPYGVDLKTAKDDQSLATWIEAMAAIEGWDSDGDGFVNIDEINGCALPGDPTSTQILKTTWGRVKSSYR